LAVVVLLVCAAPAAAREDLVCLRGADDPGPARYDGVSVTKFGPSTARRVLVLVPGFAGGAGDFTLVARDLVRRVDGLQVWAYDRRSQAFEDTSRFADALAGRITPRQAFEYYLGWLADPALQPRFRPLDERTVGFVRGWGLRLALEDLRRVVQSARRGGRRVILGGHSLGASMTAAYAAWDFGGRPGYRDLDGLVLVDGGALGSFTARTLAGVRRELRRIRTGSPFADLLGLGLPWAAGVFAEAGGLFALRAPTARSEVQDFPLLPAAFKPSVPVTNRGPLDAAFDRTTSPAALALIRVRAGRLAAAGDPCDWRDGEVTPVARLAQTFAQEPANAIEWYFPRRLSLDVDGANDLRRNAITRLLGLRPYHLAQVDVPL